MHSRGIIGGDGFAPNEVALLETVFNGAWDKIEGRYKSDDASRARARDKLAAIVVSIGKCRFIPNVENLQTKALEMFDRRD